MSDKKTIAALALVVLLLLGGGYYFLFAANKSQIAEVPTDTTEEEMVLTLKPEDIGLLFSARADKKAVKFEIEKVAGITAVEYQVTYTAEGDIPRGAIGNVEVEEDMESIESAYIDLGTCSANKCKYDVVVSPVELVLKITKDGKVYQVEDSLEL